MKKFLVAIAVLSIFSISIYAENAGKTKLSKSSAPASLIRDQDPKLNPKILSQEEFYKLFMPYRDKYYGYSSSRNSDGPGTPFPLRDYNNNFRNGPCGEYGVHLHASGYDVYIGNFGWYNGNPITQLQGHPIMIGPDLSSLDTELKRIVNDPNMNLWQRRAAACKAKNAIYYYQAAIEEVELATGMTAPSRHRCLEQPGFNCLK